MSLVRNEPTLSQQIGEGISWAPRSYENPLEERSLSELTAASGESYETFCLNDACHELLSLDGLAKMMSTMMRNVHDAPHAPHSSKVYECSDCHKAHAQSVVICSLPAKTVAGITESTGTEVRMPIPVCGIAAQASCGSAKTGSRQNRLRRPWRGSRAALPKGVERTRGRACRKTASAYLRVPSQDSRSRMSTKRETTGFSDLRRNATPIAAEQSRSSMSTTFRRYVWGRLRAAKNEGRTKTSFSWGAVTTKAAGPSENSGL